MSSTRRVGYWKGLARGSRRWRRGWGLWRGRQLGCPSSRTNTLKLWRPGMAFTLARIACRGQVGLDAPLVHVEVTVGAGLPAFCIVGLAATVVKESKERVRAALLSSGFEFPAGH